MNNLPSGFSHTMCYLELCEVIFDHSYIQFHLYSLKQVHKVFKTRQCFQNNIKVHFVMVKGCCISDKDIVQKKL